MTNVLYRATKYMNAEDALLAHEERPKKRERQEDTRQDRGRKVAKTGDQSDEKRSRPPTGRFTNFTPLTALIDQLKGDPNKRPRDKYCRFHRDHGHDTTNCYDLKQQIEALIRQGKLQRFVSRERTDTPEEQAPRRENDRPRPPIGDIRMIVGGTTATGSSKKARKTYLRMVHSVQLTGSVPKMPWIDNPVINFSEDDARRIHHPHDDVLVVSLQIGDYNMHRVLVDNSSSTDILYYPTFQQMRIDKERLSPTNALLVGFGGTKVFPLGSIMLAVTTGDYPQQITKEMTFLVVDCLSAYNAILGRPTLNSWKAITSTYHLMIKFPTEYGVGELQGNQVAARECYIAMLEMEDQQQKMCIGKQRALAELVEELEEVKLDDTRPE
ncbi:uncharacterized protein LOC115965138 [Quercus lobata]|uniref:uncharacterized protein LOC115965138 n=1 Tax=Quercus lobata TaxID=97700 RepID=UPI001245E1F0|nr:uncharacterized protein LOC115965138 [Quercus lobata]